MEDIYLNVCQKKYWSTFLKLKVKKQNYGEVSILINDFTDISEEIIIDIAKRIKRLNIITNHIEKCKRVQEYLYNEFGIMLSITNNKRKSLLKSEIILNIDFVEESINKYKIYDNAIIVNINNKISLQSKRFNGININYYKIQIPEEYKLENFQNEIMYESLIYGRNYKYINEKIIKDEIRISKLIGNNGVINKYEIAKMQGSVLTDPNRNCEYFRDGQDQPLQSM